MRFSSFTSGLGLVGAALLTGFASAAPAAAPGTGLSARAGDELVPDTILNEPKKVIKWLKEESGVDPTDKFVFYVSKDGGREMANAFIAANDGMIDYWKLFGDKFKAAFGGPDVSNSAYAKPLSQAFAVWAKGKTYAFNLDKADDSSYWNHEKPLLLRAGRVTNIYHMNDGATSIDDVKEDLMADDDETELSEEESEAAEETVSQYSDEIEMGDEDDQEDIQEDAEDEDLPESDDSQDPDFVPDSDSSDDSILPDAEEVVQDVVDNVIPDVPMPDIPGLP